MLTTLMRKLIQELSDDDLEALTEMINDERQRRQRLRQTPRVSG